MSDRITEYLVAVQDRQQSATAGFERLVENEIALDALVLDDVPRLLAMLRVAHEALDTVDQLATGFSLKEQQTAVDALARLTTLAEEGMK